MSWKPPEKDLTESEAIELAKKELAPFWFRSTPLITAVQNEDRWVVFSLDIEFRNRAWLIFVIDPTEFSGESVLAFAKEWGRRYSAQQLGILLILLPVYSFLCNTRHFVTGFMEKHQIQFPVAVDSDGGSARAFGVNRHPHVLLQKFSQRFSEYSGQESIPKIELDVQTFLRSTDPGLPLLPLFQVKTQGRVDMSKIELGFAPKYGPKAKYIEPVFDTLHNGAREGQFLGIRPQTREPEHVILSGKWIQDAEKICTSDSSATLQLVAASSELSIIAEALYPEKESPRILVEVNGTAPTDRNAGEHLSFDDQGNGVVAVDGPQLYHLLIKLPEHLRVVVLRFSNATTSAIAVYGFRFGTSSEVLASDKLT